MFGQQYRTITAESINANARVYEYSAKYAWLGYTDFKREFGRRVLHVSRTVQVWRSSLLQCRMSVPEADIREFELVIEINLRPLLHRRFAELERARATRREIESLQLQVDLLAQNTSSKLVKPLKALVDIGSDFRVNARIGQLQTVAVDVGCGIYLEWTLHEAKAYCAGRLTSLAQLISVLEAEVQKTATDLVIAESGLKELHAMERSGSAG